MFFKYMQHAIIYIMCLYYSLKAVIGIVYLFLTKFHKKFWIVKDRPNPPKCLQNKEFGEHKYLKANGIKFHYVEKGDPSKPLILFVHGFPEFWYSWRYQIKEFSKDYWCIALDMRGYGDTDKPKEKSAYKIDVLADDIKCFVEALDREKFILIAHDWGAIVSWHYVQKYMNTIEKYICLSAAPPTIWYDLVFSSFEQFRKTWYVFLFHMPGLPEYLYKFFDYHIIHTLRENKSNNTLTDEDMEAYKYIFCKSGLRGPINYYRNITSFHNSFKTKTFAPGLYLLGEHDKYTDRRSGVYTQKMYKNVEFKIIPGGHHFVQQNQPEKVNKMIHQFLKK